MSPEAGSCSFTSFFLRGFFQRCRGPSLPGLGAVQQRFYRAGQLYVVFKSAPQGGLVVCKVREQAEVNISRRSSGDPKSPTMTVHDYAMAEQHCHRLAISVDVVV